MATQAGLRERKKEATRIALAEAAARLVLELGPDAVTTDAIAEAAGVSPRTFRNYFTSKEEAVVHSVRRRTESLIPLLRDRPADEPIWAAMQNAIRESMGDANATRQVASAIHLIGSRSSLLPHYFAWDMEFEREIAEVIAARTGTDAEVDLYPNLLATALQGALKSGHRVWNSGRTGAAAPVDVVLEALAQLRAGIPEA
ncbi:TetR/AcrR family transcriptional regulator [Nocardia sp. NPDC052566]|uniref:TetR/AcrR family transcriptional regulator n=1 Tax=Nocardia sp. NPDC052566 TaxID=3364330 RepID=UPI0037C6570D